MLLLTMTIVICETEESSRTSPKIVTKGENNGNQVRLWLQKKEKFQRNERKENGPK